MRMISKKEFLKLPPGIVYTQIDGETVGIDGDLEIKGESIEDFDWYYMNLYPDLDADDSGEYSDMWFRMQKGEEMNTDHAWERDGFYEDTPFIIFNRAEVQSMIEKLQESLEMTK